MFGAQLGWYSFPSFDEMFKKYRVQLEFARRLCKARSFTHKFLVYGRMLRSSVRMSGLPEVSIVLNFMKEGTMLGDRPSWPQPGSERIAP